VLQSSHAASPEGLKLRSERSSRRDAGLRDAAVSATGGPNASYRRLTFAC